PSAVGPAKGPARRRAPPRSPTRAWSKRIGLTPQARGSVDRSDAVEHTTVDAGEQLVPAEERPQEAVHDLELAAVLLERPALRVDLRRGELGLHPGRVRDRRERLHAIEGRGTGRRPPGVVHEIGE